MGRYGAQDPSTAVKRMRAASAFMERTLEETTRKLNMLRVEHAKTLEELDTRYKAGYKAGYESAVGDIKERLARGRG